jgi:hypothetical protein
MRRWSQLGITASFACLAGWLIWHYGATFLPFGAVASAVPNPQDGKVANGAFTNAYFNLAYPLLPGWTEGLAGPDPSHSGYYVLGNLVAEGATSGTIFISAQDLFFAQAPEDVAAAAADFRRDISKIDGMTIDREPAETTIANHVARRVDYSGIGLYRAMVMADIRCHLVSFTLTARSAEERERLVQSLGKVASVKPDTAAPACKRDYATADNVLRKVEPESAGASPMPVPVRIIIGADGTVQHVNVIRAAAMQRRSIEEALRQWRFRPYLIEGRAVAIETGLAMRMR